MIDIDFKLTLYKFDDFDIVKWERIWKDAALERPDVGEYFQKHRDEKTNELFNPELQTSDPIFVLEPMLITQKKG